MTTSELLKSTEVKLKEINFRLSGLDSEESALEAFFGNVDYSRNAAEKEMLWKRKEELLDRKEMLLHQLQDEIDNRKNQIDSRVIILERTNDQWMASHGMENSGIMELINTLMDERECLVKAVQKLERRGGFYGNI